MRITYSRTTFELLLRGSKAGGLLALDVGTRRIVPLLPSPPASRASRDSPSVTPEDSSPLPSAASTGLPVRATPPTPPSRLSSLASPPPTPWSDSWRVCLCSTGDPASPASGSRSSCGGCLGPRLPSHRADSPPPRCSSAMRASQRLKLVLASASPRRSGPCFSNGRILSQPA